MTKNASYLIVNLTYSAMNVNQNDVRTYLADVLKRDHNIRFTVQKTQYPVISRNHDLTDAAAARIKFQIAHLAKLLAVLYVNDILTFQL